MKIRSLFIFGITGIVLTAGLCAVLTRQYSNTLPTFTNPEKLGEAVRAFARDEKIAGRWVPDSVSLRVLVRHGYLTAEDVRPFEGEGLEGSISLTAVGSADWQTLPQTIVMQVRMPDGMYLCILGDGSVQQLSEARFHQAFPR